MPVGKTFQNNFTTGVISPAMAARIDLQKYASGCEKIVNGIVLAHGGIANRPGTLFVDAIPGNGVLIPFAYSVEQTYVLCFMDKVMHVYRDGGVVCYPQDYEVETKRGSVVEVNTPYSFAELTKVRYTQSADTMFFVHPAHPPMKLIRYDHHKWEFEEMRFEPEIVPPVNLKAASSGFKDASNTYTPTTCSYKVASVNSNESESLPSAPVEARILSTWPAGAKVTLTWDAVTGAVRYEVYKNARGWWTWIGSAEDTTFTDDFIEGDDSSGPKSYRNPFAPIPAPEVIVKLEGFAGTLDKNGDTKAPENTNVFYFSVVAKNGAGTQVSLPSPRIGVTLPKDWPKEKDGTAKAKLTLRWGKIEGAEKYVVYSWDTNGVGHPHGEQTETEKVFDSKSSIIPESSVGTPGTAYGPGNNYPGAVGIFQQRLVFGRSNNEPQTVWTTETGAFDSLAVANPQRADSAITATVDSRQMNEIRHFIPLKNMLILTSGAEIIMGPGQNSDAVTPTSIRFDFQSYWGTSDVPPVVIGDSLVATSYSGRAVRDFYYQISNDGYSGSEVSILAEHLITSPIVSWAYQEEPFNTIWICLKEGKLLTFTYMREQEVWAWSEHESEGAKFRSVAVVRENAVDSVYFLVERFERFFIEKQVLREYGDPIEGAFFVDCGLSYQGEPTKHLTGMRHLAGKKIVALTDGSVVRDITVASDGSFNIPEEASRVQAGLNYAMTVQTVDPEIKTDDGGPYGQRKSTVRARFVLRESVGLEAGADAQHLTILKFPVPVEYGAPPSLFTGVLETQLPGLYRRSASVTFRQPDPLPTTVLGIVVTVAAE